jgi:hypothetical protein
MYATSDKYKASLDSGWLNTDVRGKITLTNGNEIEFDESNIVPGSLTYTNKALNGNDFCFGGVYTGELTVDLMLSVDRYSLKDAKIEVQYIHTTADGVTDVIPIGIFYVYEATRTKKIISFKAYDSMTCFDAEVEETTSGTLYDLLTYMSEKCNVPLAQSEQEINAFVNSEWWLTLDMEQISTYREALSSIGLLCGRFATINRNGELEFRTFKMEPEDRISARRRTESTVADFRTFFYGVKARFLSKENFYPYIAVDETMTTGLLLDLGDITVFKGEDTSKKAIMNNLLQVALGIKYVPMELSMISDPSIDLGDCLELMNINYSEESVLTSVHSITWTYHSKNRLSSFGSNPKLKGIVSREDRILSQLEVQMSTKDLIVKTYTNSKKITVNEKKEQEVFLFNFATTAKTTVMFMGTVPFEADLDGVAVFKTYLDGALDETATVHYYFERGSHVVSLTNYFPMAADGRATLKITMITEYFESDYRKQNTDVISILDYVQNQGIEVDDKGVPHLTKEFTPGEIDVTPPVVNIKKSTIKGLLFAQGIAGAGQWDGTINVTDGFAPVALRTLVNGGIRVGCLRDSARFTEFEFLTKNITERLTEHIKAGGEKTIGKLSDAASFEMDQIPVGQGVDYFIGVKVGIPLRLGFMNDTTGISTKEEEEDA